jgi:ketosteroid isomerase-like protein
MTHTRPNEPLRRDGVHVTWIALLLAAVTWLGCERSGTQQAGPDPAQVAQVRRASEAWDAAHNAGDVGALMELYSDSAVSMPYDRPALVGRAAIAEDMRKFFQDYRATHKTEILGLEIVNDWAIERGHYTLTSGPRDVGGLPLSDPPVNAEVGKHIVVRHRENGDWKIHWEIWNLDSTRVP